MESSFPERTGHDAAIETLEAMQAFLEAGHQSNGEEDDVITLLKDPMVQAFLVQNLPEYFRGQPTQAHLRSLVKKAAAVSGRIREAIKDCAGSGLLHD